MKTSINAHNVLASAPSSFSVDYSYYLSFHLVNTLSTVDAASVGIILTILIKLLQSSAKKFSKKLSNFQCSISFIVYIYISLFSFYLLLCLIIYLLFAVVVTILFCCSLSLVVIIISNRNMTLT